MTLSEALDRALELGEQALANADRAIAGWKASQATRDSFRDALGAIANSDGSWNVAAYAQDVIDGTYDEATAKDYSLDPGMVAVALGQLAREIAA